MNHTSSGACFFCDALQQPDGIENLILHRGENAFIILNRYPYASGHLMIVPFQHQPTYEALDSATRAEMMELINTATTLMRRVYKPDAFNVGANIGAAAGAGVADHVHFHIVPRWVGDTNYMTTLGHTRVLPEDLSDTYRRLKAAWLPESSHTL